MGIYRRTDEQAGERRFRGQMPGQCAANGESNSEAAGRMGIPTDGRTDQRQQMPGGCATKGVTNNKGGVRTGIWPDGRTGIQTDRRTDRQFPSIATGNLTIHREELASTPTQLKIFFPSMYRPPRTAEDMPDYNALEVPTPGPNEDLSKQARSLHNESQLLISHVKRVVKRLRIFLSRLSFYLFSLSLKKIQTQIIVHVRLSA